MAERALRLWQGIGAATARRHGPAAAAAVEADAAAAAFLRLFAAAPDGHALLDAEGRIVAANPALARLAGPAVPLRPGLPVAQLLAPEARGTLARCLRDLLAGAAEAEPFLAPPADPASVPDAAWAVTCRRVPGDHLAPGAAVVLLHARDRTEERRAAGRLAAAARLETVGRLAGGIAHDFNNLLGAVLGAADAMRAAGLSEEAAAELATIEDGARRGAALVRQILAFAGRQHLQPEVLDLNRALGAAAPLLRRLLGRGVALELALGAEAAPVRVDPAQLDQVILNLAANARDAMPRGGTLRIATSRAVVLRPEGEGPGAVPPGRWVVLEVADTGAGVPPEVLPRLFEPFFTTRPDRGGTGLGLATVQGIVAQSGGHIAVESRVGQGTTFRIHLPRHEEAVAEVAAASAPAAAAALSAGVVPNAGPAVEAVPAAPGAAGESVARASAADSPPGTSAEASGPVAGGRGLAAAAPPAAAPAARAAAAPPAAGPILLVDDEAPLRRLAERLLARAGHAVAAADSAEAALDLVADLPGPPAAVVTDVAMPGEDGLALAKRLRARWPGLPVLLLSGYADAVLGEDLRASGLRLLPKPFAPADLVAAVSALLASPAEAATVP